MNKIIRISKKYAKKILTSNQLTRYFYDRWKGRFIIREIDGLGNKITIGKDTQCYGTLFRIHGNNNRITIGYGCMIGPKCSFVILGNNIEITIGELCSFHDTCYISASEDNSKLTIGNDAQFSNHIVVRTSDDHPFYDKETGKRLNPPKNVIIEEHVWVAPNTKILKGSHIHQGCIIGSDTTINGEVPANSMAVGRPFKIVRNNIIWEREGIFNF